jgi:hypothetical protein
MLRSASISASISLKIAAMFMRPEYRGPITSSFYPQFSYPLRSSADLSSSAKLVRRPPDLLFPLSDITDLLMRG